MASTDPPLHGTPAHKAREGDLPRRLGTRGGAARSWAPVRGTRALSRSRGPSDHALPLPEGLCIAGARATAPVCARLSRSMLGEEGAGAVGAEVGATPYPRPVRA
jgi:hypothetical protein